MRLGDITERLIEIITFGKGKAISMAIASLFGFKDCGCNKRKVWLNNLFRPAHKKEYPI